SRDDLRLADGGADTHLVGHGGKSARRARVRVPCPIRPFELERKAARIAQARQGRLVAAVTLQDERHGLAEIAAGAIQQLRTDRPGVKVSGHYYRTGIRLRHRDRAEPRWN